MTSNSYFTNTYKIFFSYSCWKIPPFFLISLIYREDHIFSLLILELDSVRPLICSFSSEGRFSSSSQTRSQIDSIPMISPSSLWDLYVTPESSKLTICSMDGPEVQAWGLIVCLFLVIYSLSMDGSRSKLSPNCGRNKLLRFEQTAGRLQKKNGKKERSLLDPVSAAETRWTKRLTSLLSGLQSLRFATDVKCQLKLVVLRGGKSPPFLFLLQRLCFHFEPISWCQFFKGDWHRYRTNVFMYL